MIDLGVVRPGSTIRIPFASFDKDDGSSITMTNFDITDILVYKDGNTTERASTNGFTATTDFDSKTGKHLAIIDLSDNTTAGFWAAGSEYLVAINAVTVDTVTTGTWIGRFRIGQRAAIYDTTIATLSTQTSFTLSAGPAEDDAINGMWCLIHDVASAVQMSWALISDYTGSTKTVTLAAAPTFTIAATDNISIMFPAPLQPTVPGRTLDVSSGGEAGLDWANVGSPATTVGLSGTTISTSQGIASVSGAVGSVTGNVGGNVTGSVGSISGVSFPTNFASLGINVSGHVSRVTLCDTTTTNTDMLTAAGIRTAVGLASANLDTQLGTLATASALSSLVTTVGAAGAGLTALAPAATALSTANWTTARAGYLDALNGGIVVKRNTALANFEFLMVLSSDHATAATGKTITATRSIDGGAFVSCTNSASEVSSGIYKISLSAADLNGTTVTLRFTATACDDTFITILTQP